MFTDREKAILLYGYLLRMAEESLEEGLFKGLSKAEVVEIFINACSYL